MTPEQVATIPDHVIAREVAGELVLMDLESGTYFALDPVGARIWEHLLQGRTLSDVCENIHAEFDAPRATIEEDVAELCTTLVERKLIVPVG